MVRVHPAVPVKSASYWNAEFQEYTVATDQQPCGLPVPTTFSLHSTTAAIPKPMIGMVRARHSKRRMPNPVRVDGARVLCALVGNAA